jgi:hypothetical protein
LAAQLTHHFEAKSMQCPQCKSEKGDFFLICSNCKEEAEKAYFQRGYTEAQFLRLGNPEEIQEFKKVALN